MTYKGTVIRPPSEADSLLIQVTYGCSHDKCAFCGTYPGKAFKIRTFAEIKADLEWAKKNIDGEFRRIFLCDGDAMCLSFNKLMEILNLINSLFPDIQRIGIYANARNILAKTEEELTEFSRNKLTIAYLGLESGSDKILKAVNKGSTAREMTDAVIRAQKCGIKMSVIGLLGLGGRKLSREHALETARVCNAMNPRFLSFLTLMLVPGTPLCDDYENGRFELLTAGEMLEELHLIVTNLELNGTIFRTNHASNYAPLEGTLPKDKDKLLRLLKTYLRGEAPVKDEFWRGL
ncbi:MAG: radical SAM protein [Planctomycetes bacterium]|nr:radical SAM protein [Planctomycetota bacterium]